jgi:hypothetical protein
MLLHGVVRAFRDPLVRPVVAAAIRDRAKPLGERPGGGIWNRGAGGARKQRRRLSTFGTRLAGDRADERDVAKEFPGGCAGARHVLCQSAH